MTATSRHRGPSHEPFTLVLGAGGRPGLAYHAGTLLALDLHGYRPGDATSIVGTSAGSIAAALFCTGGTPEDLAAHVTRARPRDAFRDVAAHMAAAEQRPVRVDVRGLQRALDPRAAWLAASHLRSRRYVAALTTFSPGLLQLRRRFTFFDEADGADDAGVGAPPWRVVAAERNGSRRVLTRRDVRLSVAVAASCAIPGVFAPVLVDGRRLVDGGLHSTTNADLATGDASDLVIVLAPMCGSEPERGPVNPFEADLRHEVGVLREAGRRVIVFRPSRTLRTRMGRNPLAAKRSREITAAAFLEAADGLAELGPSRRQRIAAISA